MKLELSGHLSFISLLSSQVEHRAAAEQLASLSGVVTVQAGQGFSAPLAIELTSDYGRHPGVPARERWNSPLSFMEQSVSLTLDGHAEPAQFNPGWSIDQHIDPLPVARKLTALGVRRAVDELLLCLAIARPMAAQTAGQLTIDAGPTTFRFPVLRHGPSDIAREAAQLGWPRVRTLQLRDVWAWARPLFMAPTEMGEGRVGRALAAYSQVVTAEARNSPIDLVWAVMGLEALYGGRNAGLEAQIFEKSAILLGKPSAHAKRIRSIYNFRSRLVHGDVDIPFSHGALGDESANAAFQRESTDNRHIAAAMLLATLQELVIRRRHELAFEYTLSPIS